ncbi:MAG: hypothetical protein VX583_12150 [Bdellovibrionota bacterium]
MSFLFQRILNQLEFVKRSQVFWFVLLFKLVLGSLFASTYLRELFLPFLNDFIANNWANPWDLALEGKVSGEFPYSGMMLIIMSSFLSLGKIILPAQLYQIEQVQMLLARIPLLVADTSILLVLLHWFKEDRKKVLWFYWASPILIYISYVHGQLDVLPTAFLFLSLFAIFRGKYFWTGLFLGAGIASKFHLVIALPFIVAFIVKNVIRQTAIEKKLARFFSGLTIPLLLFVLPFLGSEGYQNFVIGTGETKKLFQLSFPFSDDLFFLIAPAALFLLFLRFVSSYRVNRNLLLLSLTLVYSSLVVLVPPMPGWYFWSIPLLIYFFIIQDEVRSGIYWSLSALFVVYYLGVDYCQELVSYRVFDAVDLKSLLFTALQSTFVIIIYWLYKLGVKKNSFFSHRRKPLLIGVGGDSGAGKDTFVENLTCVLGQSNWVQNNGDDYHRWERGHIEWSKKTHLDPQANHMYLPVVHIEKLKKGQKIKKTTYDHGTGKFTDPIALEPKPFILFVGLHPFYIRRLRQLIDLKIYVGPDERLRKYWKIQRDRAKRGYTKDQVLEQIAKRQKDSENYIWPQRDFADWVVSYSAINEIDENFEIEGDLQLKVTHSISNDVHVEELIAALKMFSSMNVEWSFAEDLSSQKVSFWGVLGKQDIINIAENTYKDIYEYIGHDEIDFKENLEGVSQLLFLAILKSKFNELNGE